MILLWLLMSISAVLVSLFVGYCIGHDKRWYNRLRNIVDNGSFCNHGAVLLCFIDDVKKELMDWIRSKPDVRIPRPHDTKQVDPQ